MGAEKWLSAGEAVEIIRHRFDASIGRAQAILERARASGEVRSEILLVLNDDGIVGMGVRPGRAARPGARPAGVDKDDLLHWLDQQEPQATKAPKRSQGKRDRAREAIAAKWPAGIPGAHKLPNDILCREVNDWVKTDCKKQSIPPVDFSNDTILRAAGRKN
jgi:hypothetical protein